ncbi:Hsp20 family protein [Acidaminobacter sp. JC074]|uniref:Hsp20 family protein n=1 Tax=Acidaminobacter sp. JC074 TaxID=2530199 RepID=UPI001F10382F|nr:Hsp20 family protein [Acidaminobacter sp. JC074]MCH4888555.1 Hsp20 family protein [Acidaminobacter sp. JC074]
MKLVTYRNDEMNNMFNMMDEFFNSVPQKEMKRGFRLDVLENDKEFVVEGELPGIQRDNINIDFENNLLKISVEQTSEENVEEKNYVHRERKMYSMERVLRFKDVDPENIQAKLENGILKVILPKVELVDTKKRIEVQ